MDITDALEMFCLTHPGMVRAHNEDSVACEPACGLVVLTDGMGGYNAGEVASGIAVSVVSSEIKHFLEDARPEDIDVDSVAENETAIEECIQAEIEEEDNEMDINNHLTLWGQIFVRGRVPT